MPPNSSDNRYSSQVRLQLLAQGQMLELAQVSGEYLILSAPADLPPCEAELLITVDGEERRSKIQLVDGAQPFDLRLRTHRRRP